MHEKSSQPVYPRRELFLCYNCDTEKYLCPGGDYETHLKVHYEEHRKADHQFDKRKFTFKVYEDIKASEEKCKSCGLKTFSKFLWFLHEFWGVHGQISIIKSERERSKSNRRPITNDSTIRFKCGKCEYITHRKPDLTKHEIFRHTPDHKIEWFYCPHCSFKAKLKHRISTHIGRKHSNDSFECDKCDYKTDKKYLFENHKLHNHLRDDEIAWCYCTHCSFKSKSKRGLYSHIKRKHTPSDEQPDFECAHCPYKTKDASVLKRHIIRKHTAEDDIKWSYCTQCSYRAKLKDALSTHIRRVHTPKQI